jgi:hypothetical protein
MEHLRHRRREAQPGNRRLKRLKITVDARVQCSQMVRSEHTVCKVGCRQNSTRDAAECDRSSIPMSLVSVKTERRTEANLKAGAKTYFIDVECPPFSDIQKIFEQGGYSFTRSAKAIYVCPSGESFSSLRAFRDDLCAYGVACQCKKSEEILECPELPCHCWTHEDKETIDHWVRYAVIRGPKQLGSVRRLNSSHFFVYAQRLGCIHFDANIGQRHGYGLPGTKPDDKIDGVRKFRSLHEFIHFLARFGLPENCHFDRLSDDERLRIELFLATFCSLADTLYVRSQIPAL